MKINSNVTFSLTCSKDMVFFFWLSLISCRILVLTRDWALGSWQWNNGVLITGQHGIPGVLSESRLWCLSRADGRVRIEDQKKRRKIKARTGCLRETTEAVDWRMLSCRWWKAYCGGETARRGREVADTRAERRWPSPWGHQVLARREG